MTEITKMTSVSEIVKACPTARKVFDEHGLKGCGGENGPRESLAFFAAVHQVDVEALVQELNAALRGISVQSRIDGHHQNAARAESDVDVRGPLEAPQEKPRGAQQHQRHGDLRDHQKVAQAPQATWAG